MTQCLFWILAVMLTLLPSPSQANETPHEAGEQGVHWEEVTTNSDWMTKLEGHELYMFVRKEGLVFSVLIRCDSDAPNKTARYNWQAGDRYGITSKNCQGLYGLMDVRFHLSKEFVTHLPLYPTIIYLFVRAEVIHQETKRQERSKQ